MPDGAKHGTHGTNDFGRLCMAAPDLPGELISNFLSYYALNTVLGLDNDATRIQVGAAMQGHVLAEAISMGKYNRQLRAASWKVQVTG